MTLKGLVSLVFGFIGLAEGPRNKEASPCYLLSSTVVPPKTKHHSSEPSAAAASNFSEAGWCCVCLSRLNEEGDKGDIRVLPCLHKFHKICVNKWLKGRHKTCPLCRFSMGAEDKSHRAEMFTEEMAYESDSKQA